jgi:hypothetical protein
MKKAEMKKVVKKNPGVDYDALKEVLRYLKEVGPVGPRILGKMGSPIPKRGRRFVRIKSKLT